MNYRSRSITALYLVAILVMSASLAMGAAPTLDTETTTTTTQTGVGNNATIQYNASINSTMQASFDSNNGSFKILQNGTLLSEYKNSSSPSEISVVDATNNHLNLTLTDDETGYEGIEADAGETVELTYRLINNTDVSNPDTTNVTVNWANHDNKSFARADSAEVETANTNFISELDVFGFGPNVSVGPAQAEVESIGVNGDSQDEITVHVSDSDAQSAFEETHDKAGDTGLTWLGTASLDGEALAIMAAGEDGPDWVDTDEEAYVTISETGDEVVVHNAGDVLGSNTENATLEVVGADNAGGWYARSLAANYDASLPAQASALISARDPAGIFLDPSFEE